MAELVISKGFVAQVDDEDLPELLRHKWTYVPSSNKIGYAARWVSIGVHPTGRPIRKPLYMHRQILNAPPEFEVDHVDNNGLNNKRNNLRLANDSQNNVNKDHRSKYRGVYPYRGVWKAQAKVNKRSIWLGSFSSPEAAAIAYDRFVLATWGEFARINGVMPPS